MTDNQIITSLRSSEKNKALRQLYKSFGKITNYIKQNGGSKSDAEDIFQEALLHLIEKCQHPAFKVESTLTTYLYSVCKNLWRNQLRKSKPELLAEDDDFSEDAEDSNELILLAEKAIKKLGRKCQDLLNMFYVQRFSMEAIAQELGFANPKSAKNQKYKCLTKAKAFLNL